MSQHQPKRYLHRTCVLTLLLAIGLGLASSCTNSHKASPPHAVGEAVQVDGWTVTVLGYHNLPVDTSYPPESDQDYVVVHLAIENSTGHIRYLMFERQMALVGEEDSQAPHGRAGVVAARTKGWFPVDGEFQPGQVVRGAASYQVKTAEASKPRTWRFAAGLLPWSSIVTFDLGEPTPLP